MTSQSSSATSLLKVRHRSTVVAETLSPDRREERREPVPPPVLCRDHGLALRRSLRYGDVQSACPPKTAERRRAPHQCSRWLHATRYLARGPTPPLLLVPSTLVPPKHRP